MGISRAEKNRRKRERKKRQKEEQRKENEVRDSNTDDGKDDRNDNGDIEIEYVVESLPLELNTIVDGKNDSQDNMADVLRRFHERSTILVSDDELNRRDDNSVSVDYEHHDDGEDETILSKKKLRKMNRPTVAELKNKVERADLVEAHDITSADPEFLLFLKALPGTVPVPRHWGRKRKYLQGKRGIEKAPFKLPDFIAKTGISEVRSALDEDEGKQSIKKKNRGRVAPKMGALDVDYRTLHDAFFKHQNKASIQDKLTKIGDLYYEGKEFETQKSNDLKVGGTLSSRLRDALGMTTDNSPPPWLINMQRFGPPPSYPNLSIPGLNAPLPEGCTYGYHLNGWGKPPIDAFGRPLYGGNPFDVPGSASSSSANWDIDVATGAIITSDGKTVTKKLWGGLPIAAIDLENEDDESSDEESDEESTSSGEEMGESDDEGKEIEHPAPERIELDNNEVSAIGLRKQRGDETPAPPQQLYKVLQQTEADKEKQSGAVFQSDVQYILPGSSIPKLPEGAESVLSKAPLESNTKKRSRDDDITNDDDDGDLGKKFKF